MSQKNKKVLFTIFLLLFLSACSLTKVDSNSSPKNRENTAGTKERAAAEVTDYVGLSLEQAQTLASEKGLPFRVVMKDGEALAVTLDYRPGRINASIENNIVVSYEVEGEEQSYNFESWKEIIPSGCKSFFDGCNNCIRSENSDLAACTKKACLEYSEPKCLDAKENN